MTDLLEHKNIQALFVKYTIKEWENQSISSIREHIRPYSDACAYLSFLVVDDHERPLTMFALQPCPQYSYGAGYEIEPVRQLVQLHEHWIQQPDHPTIPIYTIWLFLKCPQELQNYDEHILCKERIRNLKNLHMVFLFLGEQPDDYKLINCLNILYGENISMHEKEEILQSEFDLDPSMKEVLRNMDYVKKAGKIEGKQEQLLQCIKNLMESLNCDAEHAMDLLKVEKNQRIIYSFLHIN